MKLPLTRYLEKLSMSSKGDSGPQSVVRGSVLSLGFVDPSLARWSLGVSQRRSHGRAVSLGHNSGYQRSMDGRGCSSGTWKLSRGGVIR